MAERKSGSQPAVTHTPLVSTVVRAQQKMRKYSPIAEANGYTLLPFGVETYGGMGKEALRGVLQYLAAHAQNSPQVFLRHAHSSLSVVLTALRLSSDYPWTLRLAKQHHTN